MLSTTNKLMVTIKSYQIILCFVTSVYMDTLIPCVLF